MELLKSSIKCDSRYFQHYYLCSYLPLAAGPDDRSLSLIRFKQRTQPDLDVWIEHAARLLATLHFPPETIIIRALRHEETTVRPEFPAAVIRRSLPSAPRVCGGSLLRPIRRRE